MRCIDCEYCGTIIEHLKGFENIEDWRQCSYPLPFHQHDKAIPGMQNHECPVFIKKYNIGSFDNYMKPYRTGRQLKKIDLKILEGLVRLQLNIAVETTEMKNIKTIERTQNLINDLQTLIHIWKKNTEDI
jgi:hypothetical protein